MADLPDSGPVGLEDQDAFESTVVAGLDAETAGRETTLLPEITSEAAGASPTGEKAAWAGKALGHFKLLRLIGEGSMGVVIQAMDVNLHRIVALKVLRKRIVGVDEQQRVAQFLREARAAARIEHPNVVRIYEINEHDGWWYIAMEMLHGDSVKRIVQATGAMAPARACPVIADAAVALNVAHSLGIIHRDVKPSNLMVTRSGRCKLTDFGLVRLDDPDDPFDFTDRSVGTPQFAAPELIAHRRASPAADVYSLGGSLYYALTGHYPYVGHKVAEILHQHVEAPPPELSAYLPNAPESLAVWVRRAMAKDPADRPTAADFATALHAEAILWRAEESGALSGTSVGSSLLGLAASGSAPAGSPPPAARSGLLDREVKPRWAWILGPIVALVVMAALILPSVLNSPAAPDGPGLAPRPPAPDISQRFPDAPRTYGVRAPGSVPAAAGDNRDAPPFSWVHTRQTTGLQFVASRRGRHFYRIDDPAALLIRAEDFVGYASSAQARADGKVPRLTSDD